MGTVKTDSLRWRVDWIDGDGRDMFQLVECAAISYFESAELAKEFAASKRIASAPFYYQPLIRCERKFIVSTETEVWKVER